ncbi:LysR family transcriptional regulator [Litoribacillus peritrichatus]|uniref:LysR family transcriptional regulator n=1 Tax=Litoribacillus peritrichatus TaxID=718191 RepID=A0ABP7MY21_9GAMM
MNWRSINFDWNRARAFLVTAEEGSFSAAAKALGMSQPTLGRQVSALEDELNVVLFEKVGKGIVLTPSGEELLAHVKQMGAAASEFSLAATGQSHSIEGTVSISATEVMAAYILAPLLKKLRKTAPGIHIEIIATNEASDLRRREADIAIRNFQPQHADLIARRMTDGQGYLYATPDYLNTLGTQIHFEQLNRADYVGFTDNPPLIKALNSIGLSLTAKNFPFITESHIVHWEIVKNGAAIGVMPDFIGDYEPRVQRVMPDLEPVSFGTWLVVHRELRTNRKVRLVYDFLAEELSRVL